jgi:hypothetical protein
LHRASEGGVHPHLHSGVSHEESMTNRQLAVEEMKDAKDCLYAAALALLLSGDLDLAKKVDNIAAGIKQLEAETSRRHG